MLSIVWEAESAPNRFSLPGSERDSTHNDKNDVAPRTPLVPICRTSPPPRLAFAEERENLGGTRHRSFLETTDGSIFPMHVEGFRPEARGGGGRGSEEVPERFVVDLEKRDAEREGPFLVLLEIVEEG